MPDIRLSPEQSEAMNAINAFISDGSENYFVLHGLAGSGKTTVLAEVARNNRAAILCTLTGKAASVLRDKTDLPACTIHSAFYKLKEINRLEDGKQTMTWDKSRRDGDLTHGVILLDECSMVNDAMAKDLLATGAKIVACGDPGQLPPVVGAQFFSKPTVTLREIHRQAKESPIIRQAHSVRSTGTYEPDGAFTVAGIATDDQLLAADAILTWTHKTRRAANAELRRLHGHWMPHPQVGEPIMCLRNQPHLGIYNGAVYELVEKMRDGDLAITIRVDDKIVGVPHATFHGLRLGTKDDDAKAVPFDFGYALTVHKAQGSEWDNVILVDEFRGYENERRRWLYTGITRAAQSILVVR